MQQEIIMMYLSQGHKDAFPVRVPNGSQQPFNHQHDALPIQLSLPQINRIHYSMSGESTSKTHGSKTLVKIL